MKKHFLSGLLGFLVIASTSGCMSIITTGERLHGNRLDSYGGVAIESRFILSCFTGKAMWGNGRSPTNFVTCSIGAVATIDLPVTIAIDTLFLPYDAYTYSMDARRAERDFRKKEEERLEWQKKNANKRIEDKPHP